MGSRDPSAQAMTAASFGLHKVGTSNWKHGMQASSMVSQLLDQMHATEWRFQELLGSLFAVNIFKSKEIPSNDYPDHLFSFTQEQK